MTVRILNDISNLNLLNIERRKLKEIEQAKIKNQMKDVTKEIKKHSLYLQDIQEKKAVFRNHTYSNTLKTKINKNDRLSIEGKFLTFDAKISKVNKDKMESENKLSGLKDEHNKVTKQISKHLIKSEKYAEIEKLIK